MAFVSSVDAEKTFAFSEYLYYDVKLVNSRGEGGANDTKGSSMYQVTISRHATNGRTPTAQKNFFGNNANDDNDARTAARNYYNNITQANVKKTYKEINEEEV